MKDPKAVIRFKEYSPEEYDDSAVEADMEAVKAKVNLAARKHMGIGHDGQSVEARRNERSYMVVLVFQSESQAKDYCEAKGWPDSMFIDGLELAKRESIPLTPLPPMAFKKKVDTEILAMAMPIEGE